MTGSASASQRSRSGGPSPKRSPKPACSSPNQAAPIPRIARPLLMWSSVVAILATSVGSRNVFAPTISPIRTRSVAWAQAVRTSQPSKIGPCESPTIG